ncbi:type II secretion system protein GspG [bacterium]|nr:type II secretion system protein GspG [bacterium]
MPRQDLARAPGYASEGITLPLSDLTALVRRAEAPDAATSRPLSVNCRGLALRGKFDGAVATFDGELEYEAVEPGWSATRIDDGTVGWTSQQAPAGAQAFLARVNGRTMLLARGPAKGRLAVSGQVALDMTSGSLSLFFGRIEAPCRIEMNLGSRFMPGASNAPVKTRVSDAGSSVTLWPAQGAAARLALRRRPALAEGAPMRLELSRSVQVVGAGLEVHDQLQLSGRFKRGEELRLNVPQGLKPLRVGAGSNARAVLDESGASHQLQIRWSVDSAAVAVSVDSVAPLADSAATLGNWAGLWDAESSTLELVGSDKFVPVTELADGVVPTGGDALRRSYQAWGPMPALGVRLVEAAPPLPPAMTEVLDIRPNEAGVEAEINLFDSRRNAYSIELPADWVPIEFSAIQRGSNIPLTIQQGDGRIWRISWNPANAPGRLFFKLHRVGAWGAQGKSARMELPLIGIDGARPSRHELAVKWPDSMDVQPIAMEGVKVVPNRIGNSRLTLRVTAPKPACALTLTGREPNIRATVLTVLAIEEDRPRVRAQVTYDVTLAPTHTFRVLLPAGTGGAVRVQAAAIRESVRRETPQGDEWTITTQHDVLGRYGIGFEWALDQRTGARIEAPQIRVPGVASQEGFIVLEGSETLRLGIESANLVETDMGEVPPMPWPQRNRTLAAFRYVAPPFTLRVKAEKFTPEKAPAGLVHEARLVTTVAADGWRLTEANYNYAARGDSQYFDARLPEKAAVWSVRVDGRGVYPARRSGRSDPGGQWLMVPLDSSAAAQPRAANSSVSILYSEPGEPLARSTNLELAGPKLEQPTLRTQWELNLPPEYEYLAYGGTLINTTMTRQPLATFMRTAYYPRRILFPNLPFAGIVVLTVVGVVGFLVIRAAIKHKPKPAAEGSARPTISLFEILIVIVIVAVLAAIAVPNFLEAQTRSRVSRAQADMRSIAVAIESYNVDNGFYPGNLDVLWNGSVQYMSSQVIDPYSVEEGKGRRPFYYARGIEAWKRLTQAGINVGPPSENLWLVWSTGPDGRNDNASIMYDPTNGTVSAGDVFKYEYAAARTASPAQPADEVKSIVTYGGDHDGDMAVQTPQKGGTGIKQKRQLPAAPSAAAPEPTIVYPDSINLDARVSDKPESAQQVIWTFSESGGRQLNRALQAPGAENLVSPGGQAGMAAGVLSMKIDIPVGGVQRSFEALGAEGNIRLRLMDHDRFRHLSFIVWMAAFLAMGVVWARRRPLYKRTFVASAAFFLLVPVLIGGPWVVFFNRGLQGVLFSLAVPLAAKIWGRLTRHNHAVAAMIVFGMAVSFSAAAQAQNPVRILVPYDEQGPDLNGNPSAFMNRDDFSRLWTAANRAPLPGLPGRPVITRLELDGALDPATGIISGTMRMFAVNSGDAAGTVPLAMAEAQLEDVKTSGAGAAIEAGAGGLIAGLAAHWAGSIEARFKLPCPARGLEGELSLSLPEAGSGSWRVQLPFVGVTATGRGVVTQTVADGTQLSGAIRPGRLAVAWRGAPSRATALTSQSWRVRIETSLRWDDLTAARWHSTLRLERVGADGRLPEQARFELPQGLKLSSAEGEAVAGAEMSSRTLTLHLADAAEAVIELGGLLLPNGSMWQAGGPRPLDPADAKESVRIEVADEIDLAAIEPTGLRRVPTRAITPGLIAQQYEATGNWSARLELRRRPTLFDERTVAWLRPADGMIDQRTVVTLTPANSAIHECRIELPAGARALELKGPSVAGWVQTGQWLLARFNPPIENQIRLRVCAVADLPTTTSGFLIEAVRVAGARQSRHWAVVQVDPDEDLSDIDLAGSRPRPPAEIAHDLEYLDPDWEKVKEQLRAYELTGERPARLGRSAAQSSARVTTLNRVTISNGLRNLLAVVRMEPRRGRVSRIETLLLLDGPDPGAPQRVQTSGPVRHVSFEPAAGGALRVITELDAPHADPVEVRFELDQPVSTESGTSIGLTAMIPTGEGDRAFALLRRGFEGELQLTEPAGARRIDPSEAPWPDKGFQALPADQALELAPAKHATPRLRVVRHARTEALRAVVDTLRQRTILTADGIERNEVEIVLQNQSEQFLRVELPYPRAQIDIYEIQAAGRIVQPIFEPGGKSVLLVPLIRTGLLVPELTVNVAYVARTGVELGRRGGRGFNLPRVLGGVPVLQSSLVLMLPTEYRWADFRGSLQRVELIDLEVDEALRRQKRLEQVSAAAIYNTGEAQIEILSNLEKLQTEASRQLQGVIFSNDAYVRQAGEKRGKADADEDQIQREKLLQERVINIKKAEEANKAIGSNIVINKAQQAIPQQAQRPKPKPTPVATAAPLKFAQMGEVFAFRKLQGGGELAVAYSAREISDHRRNIAFTLLLIAVIAALTYGSGWLLATPRRVIALALIACAIAIVSRAALDLTIPAAAACLVALWLARRRAERVDQAE